jgi:hypothetical protein
MAIQFNCSQCGKLLSAPESAVGRKGKCTCGAIVQVPPAAPPEAEVLDAEVIPTAGIAGTPPPPPPYPQDDAGDYAMAPDPAAAPPPPGAGERRRPCPMCGEMIPMGAVKCRFCGEIFDPALKAAEQKSKSVAAGDEDLSAGEWVAAILCSGIGCIFGIVWMIQGKPKGKKMFLVSFAMSLIWTAIRAMLDQASRGR